MHCKGDGVSLLIVVGDIQVNMKSDVFAFPRGRGTVEGGGYRYPNYVFYTFLASFGLNV